MDGESGAALCGTVTVFEDREARSGRRIDLRVVVLPAAGSDAASDPVFFLSGGPGQGSASLAGYFAATYRGLRTRRDLVLVDQRGTGGSNRLDCVYYDGRDELRRLLGEPFPIEEVRRCRERLERVADLRMYTTPIAADDLDEVRAALGYERINLHGTSYGTRAALAYMRQHPERVRAVVLAGPSPTGARIPSSFAQDSERALERLFADCAADAGCSAAYPALASRFARLLARLEKDPPALRLAPRRGSPEETVTLERGPFAALFRWLLYSTRDQAVVPWIVHRAAAGDFMPFARAALDQARGTADQIAEGMYLSVTCAEDLPFIDAADAARAAAGTFLADYRVRQQKRACEAWPRGRVPDGFGDPVRSTAPALILSGELDPVTPPFWGEEVARTLPNARHVRVPNTAHNLAHPCLARMAGAFLEAGTAKALPTSCVNAIERPAWRLP
jgi:pimeloyl-ACP methyl ester carboxylesterase